MYPVTLPLRVIFGRVTGGLPLFSSSNAYSVLLGLLFASVSSGTVAHTGVLEEVLVVGRKPQASSLVRGTNAGFVGREYLDHLALERTGDLLELVPGLVATQHSGSGKANQYFLRGFNLDHGTDFATRVD